MNRKGSKELEITSAKYVALSPWVGWSTIKLHD